MTTTISEIPDYYYMKKLAHDVLMSLKHPAIPIKVMPIVKELSNKDLIAHTFEQHTKIENLDYNTFLLNAPSQDGTLHYLPDHNSYVLLYNNNIQKERKTWTIAHELGHYFGNHEIKKYNYLNSTGEKKIPEELNIVLEQEANCFAKEILAPTSLIQLMMGLFQIYDFTGIYTILRSLFRLSKEASYNIATNICKLNSPSYSKKLCLKYESEIIKYYNLFENRSFFNTLLRQYEHEIDSRDFKKRLILNPIDFFNYC